MNKLIPKHQNSSGPLEIQDVDWELIPEYAEYLKSPYKEIEDFPTWLKKQIIVLSNNKNEKVSEDKRSKKQRDKESKQGEAIHNQQQRKELEAKVNRGIWTGIGLGGLALAQITPAAPYIDAAFATHGALGLAKQYEDGTLGLNLETGLHALEMLPFGIRGVGKAVKYADDVAREAYAPYDFYRTIQETTPNIQIIPHNVGWGPKQTIKVVHATDSQDPLQLFFDKRWDVTTEDANPFGVWYLGKWGLPRTAATNSLPGKAEKAARARKLFENRKYKHLGEVTLEKPLTTVGDVPDRSALSYTAEKMGADGLIYNNVYDNGLDNNLVILSFKTHNNRPITIETDALSKITPKGAMVLQQRPPAKISAAERAGIPKGERNLKVKSETNWDPGSSKSDFWLYWESKNPGGRRNVYNPSTNSKSSTTTSESVNNVNTNYLRWLQKQNNIDFLKKPIDIDGIIPGGTVIAEVKPSKIHEELSEDIIHRLAMMDYPVYDLSRWMHKGNMITGIPSKHITNNGKKGVTLYTTNTDGNRVGTYLLDSDEAFIRLNNDPSVYHKNRFIHERIMHGTDEIVDGISNGAVPKMYQDFINKLGNVQENAAQWYELRATLGEMKAMIYKQLARNKNIQLADFKIKNLRKDFLTEIDNATLEEITNALSNINLYGKLYADLLKKNPSLLPEIKKLIKYAPVFGGAAYTTNSIYQKKDD